MTLLVLCILTGWLSMVQVQSKSLVTLNMGFWHMNDTLNIMLDDLHADKNIQCKYEVMTTDGENQKVPMTFTHGGPLSSKVLDIPNINICNDSTYGLGTTGLMCRENFYLMDSANNGKTLTITLKSTANNELREFNRFAISGYSMLLSASTKKGTGIQFIYINTFDYQYMIYEGSASIFPQEKVHRSPVVRYLQFGELTNFSGKLMLYFDGLRLPLILLNETTGSGSCLIRQADAAGAPTNILAQKIEFVDEKEGNNSIIIYEIFSQGDDLMVYLYKNNYSNAIRGIYKKITYINDTKNFSLENKSAEIEFQMNPLNSSVHEGPLAAVDKFLIRSITEEFIVFFYCNLNYSYIMVCRFYPRNTITPLNPSEEPRSGIVNNCSNALFFHLAVNQTILRFPLIDFNRDTSLRFHAEVKSIVTGMAAASMYIELDIKSNNLVLRNSWMIPANIHLAPTEKTMSPNMTVIRQRYLEVYDSKYRYAKINFSNYFGSQTSPGGINNYSKDFLCRLENKTLEFRVKAFVVLEFDKSHTPICDPSQDSSLIFVKGFNNTVTPVRAWSFGFKANNLQIDASSAENVFVDYNTPNVTINLDPESKFNYVKMIFQGHFLIGVDQSSDRLGVRSMYIYKCSNQIEMKETCKAKQDDSARPGHSRSIDCKLINQPFPVNNLVNLVDAIDLKNYLVVVFRSENSILYYKIEKFDYTMTEHNLRGFDPKKIWMAQLNSSSILVCHYKSGVKQPFRFFTLEGDDHREQEYEGMEQFKSVQALYKAGSVIEDDGDVYLYVASILNKSLSFMKYWLKDEKALVVLSGHNIIANRFLEKDAEVCFLKDRMFIIYQSVEKIRYDDLKVETVKELFAYLIDLNNPNLEYRYPLKELGLLNLMDIKMICRDESDIIVITGLAEEPKKNQAKMVFLNGSFAESHSRVLMIVNGNGTEDCLIGFPTGYVAEICIESLVKPDKIKGRQNINRFFRLVNPQIHVKIDQATNTQLVKFSGSGDSYKEIKRGNIQIDSHPLDCNSSMIIDSVFYDHIETFRKTPKYYKFGILREMIPDYRGPMLRARLTTKNPNLNLSNPSIGIKLVERIVEQRKFLKPRHNANQISDRAGFYNGFEKMVLRGDYLMTVSIITPYHILKSVLTLYRFDPSVQDDSAAEGDPSVQGGLRVKRLGFLQLDYVCAELSFVSFSNHNYQNMTVYVTAAVICNHDTTNEHLRMATFIIHPNETTTVTEMSDPRNINYLDVWTVGMSTVASTATKLEVAVLVTSKHKTHLYVWKVEVPADTGLPAGFSLINDCGIDNATVSYLYSINRVAYIVYLNESKLHIKPVKSMLNFASFPNKDFEIIEPESGPINITDFECVEGALSDTYVSCFANYSQFAVISFNLHIEQQEDWTVVVDHVYVHRLLPDMKEVDIFMVNRLIVVDAIIITKKEKKRYLVFYKKDDDSGNAWYSIDKDSLYEDFGEPVQIISFTDEANRHFIIINTDHKMYAGVLYKFTDELFIEFSSHVNDTIDDVRLELNYDIELDFKNITHTPPGKSMWFLVPLAVLFLGTCLLLIGFYIIHKVRKVRRMTGLIEDEADLLNLSLGQPNHSSDLVISDEANTLDQASDTASVANSLPSAGPHIHSPLLIKTYKRIK